MGSAELPSGFEPNNTYTPTTEGDKPVEEDIGRRLGEAIMRCATAADILSRFKGEEDDEAHDPATA